MFDLFTRDTQIAVLISASAILVVLPIQLILCFRAKKLLFRLLPALLLGVATAAFYVCAITARDWSAFAYLILAVYAGVLLVFSGIAWGIWAIAKLFKKEPPLWTLRKNSNL